LSPAAHPESVKNWKENAYTKFKLLIDWFYISGGGESETLIESFVKNVRNPPRRSSWGKPVFPIAHNDTNSVVAIARAIEFTKSRGYPGFNTNLFVTINMENAPTNIVTIYKYSDTQAESNADPVVSYHFITGISPEKLSQMNIAAELEKSEFSRHMAYELEMGEKYLFAILKEAFIGMYTNDIITVSNLITQVSLKADLRANETSELHEITQNYKLLWETSQANEDKIDNND